MNYKIKKVINSDKIRLQFPSLLRAHNNYPVIFFDGPGGTQLPSSVINAVTEYYKMSNSNTHGVFVTTQETDGVISRARKSVAAFLHAENEDIISFGQNMTTLYFTLARRIARILRSNESKTPSEVCSYLARKNICA